MIVPIGQRTLLVYCLDSTEIAVYSSGVFKVSSFIGYQGTTDTIRIGRNMGWGCPNILIAGNVTAPNLMRREAFIFT